MASLLEKFAELWDEAGVEGAATGAGELLADEFGVAFDIGGVDFLRFVIGAGGGDLDEARVGVAADLDLNVVTRESEVLQGGAVGYGGQGDFHGGAVGTWKAEVWRRSATEALGDPGAQEESGHAVIGSMGNLNLRYLREMFEGAGVLEAGGEGSAEEVGAGPTEVTNVEVDGFTF